jgi:dTDP-4-amino-4,6-dideoxygalactose transaminase
LYGTRIDLEPWIALARAHDAELWEDAAQAWTGDGWRGDARSDLVFLSFGPIKTGTALAGGLVRVADAGRRAAMGRLQDSWPRQRARAHLARLAKYACFKLVATRACFGAFDRACRLLGTTSDDVIAGSVRGFSRERLLEELRRRPAPALMASMARRLSQGERARVARQRELGESLRARLAPRAALVGGDAPIRHHWVAAVASDEPARLVAALRAAGYDATARATLACNGGAHEAPRAHWLATRLVYLPLHAEMGLGEVERLADELLAAGDCGPSPVPGTAGDDAAPRMRVARAVESSSGASVVGEPDAPQAAGELETARRS